VHYTALRVLVGLVNHQADYPVLYKRGRDVLGRTKAQLLIRAKDVDRLDALRRARVDLRHLADEVLVKLEAERDAH
jgi:hypothetical protein